MRSFGGSGAAVMVSRARVRVFRVVSRRDAEHRPGVVHRSGENRDAVERAAGRNDAARRERALGRLQPDDIVERGGHAARAGRVGAEREGDEPERHRHARAGRRAARHERRVDGVLRDGVGRAHAHEPGRELVEVRLADDDRAGRDELLDHRRGAFRRVGVGGAGGGRGQARDVDVVLHREGQAPERVARRVERRQRLGGGNRVCLCDE